MAYRRRQGVSRAAQFKDDLNDDDDEDDNKKNITNNNNNDNGSLAARAMRASAAHRDASAYGYAYASATPSSSNSPSSSSSSPLPNRERSPFLSSKGSGSSESTSMKDANNPKYGFWGILAQKAKSILDDDDDPYESSSRMKSELLDTAPGGQPYQSRQFPEKGTKPDNANLRKRLDSLTSSLNKIGDSLGNAFEEGRTRVEHRTADIIQETRNRTADIIHETRSFQIRRRGGGVSDNQDQATVLQNSSWQRPMLEPVQTSPLANQEIKLKASRDVAMATAAKAKVLLRELKTVKADLAFAKERCAQLEEENKRLRESREKGDNPADDDLIRLQLETLLAEKARLAHENSIYARENRFLREIVEYHQLTMQDIIYFDEGAEEVTEVYPISIDDTNTLSVTPTSPISPNFLPEVSALGLQPEMEEHTREDRSPSPPKVCATPDRTESLEAPTSSCILAEEDTSTSCNIQPSSDVVAEIRE